MMKILFGVLGFVLETKNIAAEAVQDFKRARAEREAEKDREAILDFYCSRPERTRRVGVSKYAIPKERVA